MLTVSDRPTRFCLSLNQNLNLPPSNIHQRRRVGHTRHRVSGASGRIWFRCIRCQPTYVMETAETAVEHREDRSGWLYGGAWWLASFVFLGITAAVGHREGTERNPGGRGAELGARFSWPPSWVLFFCAEKTNNIERVEGGKPIRWDRLGVHRRGVKLCGRSPWLPLGAFLLCRESEAERKQREEGWMALTRESMSRP